MKFILGTKENMTEYFSESGQVFPVTVVSIPPVVVTRVFEKSKDGYDAVQVGLGQKKKKKDTPDDKKVTAYKILKEFKLKPGDEIKVKPGDTIDAAIFQEGDKLQVSSMSKGKGFQGVVKRHGFHGGSRTHGQKHSEREPGSIGAGGMQRVEKGKKMAGRMGGDRVTQKNLEVILVDKVSNTILIKGAIAGRRGTLVEITSR